MCYAVRYKKKSQNSTQEPEEDIYIGSKAMIPVRQKDGGIRMVRWGKTKTETGQAYDTYWARLESLQANKWSRLQPIAVDIPVIAFAEHKPDNSSEWHELQSGLVIRGAYINDQGTERVYVVTIPVPAELASFSKKGRWPRVCQQR